MDGDKVLRAVTGNLSAKRLSAHAPFDKWYPYYAGFSYKFATAVLSSLRLRSGATIVDPWNGSGTTTVAAAHLGYKTIGLDLNPATLPIAKAKLVNREQLQGSSDLLSKVLACFPAEKRAARNRRSALSYWLPPQIEAGMERAFSLLRVESQALDLTDLDSPRALLAMCLLGAARNLAVVQGSNSTWVKARLVEEGGLSLTASEFANEVQRLHYICLSDLEYCPIDTSRAECSLGDARTMPIESNSVDAILASPPYCTRIDYAQKMSFELDAIGVGDADSFRPLRNTLMGTTTIRKKSMFLKPSPMVAEVLEKVGAHPSHRSATYYLTNFKQYFDDANRAVGEIGRVLSLGGVAALVLQNSYYKEIEIDLSTLFCDMAQQNGMEAEILVRIPVNRPAARIPAMNGCKRRYTEDVVVLRKV